ncbi:MAG: hypothetical protein H0T42_34510 [Deltaproteobacteria bacterium]|nr:hypothetical protein [Deltaproteobacteria bacterium]
MTKPPPPPTADNDPTVPRARLGRGSEPPANEAAAELVRELAVAMALGEALDQPEPPPIAPRRVLFTDPPQLPLDDEPTAVFSPPRPR